MRAAVILVVVACSGPDPGSHGLATPTPEQPTHSPAAPQPAPAAPGLRLPDGVTPLAYDLRLELDPERESFAGTVEIRIRIDAPTDHVWLHADQLEIDTARFRAGARSGVLAPVATSGLHEMRAFGFGAPVQGEVTLELAYTGQVGAEAEGVFRQKFAGKWFLYTQAEATYARRIVPCFDEPRWKVPWRVTVVVPDGQVAIGNAAISAERVIPPRREVRFAEVTALPSYLLAVAVGPFAMVEVGRVGKRGVPVRVAVAPKDAKRVGAAVVWVPKLVDALEHYFDQPLPLAKLDLVAVPRFFGAMENPGLITFEVTALAGDPRDPVFLRRHIRFLAHELSHQWLGNAVTPAWWDDLWLSEAFATWLDDKLASALGGLDDAALRTQLARAHALAADREIAAKPLRRPIATNDDIEDAFDAISYEKGAAVLAMFERYLGEDRFRDAVRAYVAGRHPSATSADFVAALAHQDPAAARAFAGYLERAGAPVVDLALDCTGPVALAITPRDHASVPVCVRYATATGDARACTLATGPTRMALAACPAWIVGNAEGRGYYHVQWAVPEPANRPPSALAKRKAAPPAKRDATPVAPSPAEQLAHGQDRAAAVARGEVTAAAAIAEIEALLATHEVHAELAALAIATELDHTVDEATAPRWAAYLASRFGRRLTRAAIWDARTPLEVALRDAVTALVPPERFARAAQLRGRELVDRALGGPAVIRAADLAVAVFLAAPAGGRALLDRIAAGARDHTFAEEWLESIASFAPALAPRAVELVFDDRFAAHHAWSAIGGMLARTPTRSAAWRAVRAELPRLLAALTASEAATMIEATATLCDPTSRAEVAAAFTPQLDNILDGRATLARSLASIDRCLATRAALGPLVLPPR